MTVLLGRAAFNQVRAILARDLVIKKWRAPKSNSEDFWFSYEYGEHTRAKARLAHADYARVEVDDALLIENLPNKLSLARIREVAI